MLYLVAIIFPPAALLFAGKVGHAVLNLIYVIVCVCLMIFGIGFLLYIGAIVHAIVVIAGKSADKRTDRIVQAMQQGQQPRR